ncbi:glycosyltransferase [Desulfobacterales bacterium HSG2]|nr:glycosyltransferase [Desulfobacterales bacterium HSG2]
MIRVLSIIHYPVFGGPHNRNMQLIPALKKLGVETIVLIPEQKGNAFERLRKNNIDVMAIPLHRMRRTTKMSEHFNFFSGFIPEVLHIQRIIHEKKTDIVQLNGLINPHGALAAKLEGVKVIWQIVDTGTPRLLQYFLLPFVHSMANKVMCNGYAVAKDHLLTQKTRNNIINYYPPVDTNIFVPDPELRLKARSELGLNSKDMIIGNIQNLNPAKGHIYFVESAAKLKQKFPEIKFVILGTKPETHKKYIENLYKRIDFLKLRIGEDVIIKDPKDRVPFLAQAFDIFWMTSVPRTEGSGTVQSEAMALKIPVVATDVGSVSEIVIDGKTGYLVPPLDPDAMVQATLPLLKSACLRQKMGERGRQFVETNLSVEKCAAIYKRTYEETLNR